MRTRFWIPLALLLASPALAQRECAPCHSKIYDSYQRTGMGRSFARSRDVGTVADFYHESSDTHYSMERREGILFQRRWQVGYDRRITNVDELSVDAVIGSGNHALTFLHRTEKGALLQLPLGWYAENGGTWGMNPGYDMPHPPVRRNIPPECLFCHNAYPENANQWPLPEGIDCQRCHGPGTKHIAAPTRGNIVNPARLSEERRLDVCQQCHLETTSAPLPALIRRFDREPFSYVPGEPLSAFILSFDHAPGGGREDKFEIAGSAYRLRESQCFLKSKGNLTCTTCHNPHDIPRGEEAAAHYAQVCRQCHATLPDAHPGASDCVTCHMPKRRTDDVVHVAMTDHRIQRYPEKRDPIPAAAYGGEVIPYPSDADPLYTALAQVYQKSNLEKGAPRLASLLENSTAQHPEFYAALGQAYEAQGKTAEAIAAYRRAPGDLKNLRAFGLITRDADVLRRALQMAPDDAETWFQLGVVSIARGERSEAAAALRKAISLNPDRPEIHYDLAAATGDEKEFREAIRLDPSLAIAHAGLAELLARRGDFTQAAYHAERSVRFGDGFAPHIYQYSGILTQLNRFEDAERQARAALKAKPDFAEAHHLLAGLLARKKDASGAIAEYETAVRFKPDFSRAHLDLGMALANAGRKEEAGNHLREAAKSSDPQITRLARMNLNALAGKP